MNEITQPLFNYTKKEKIFRFCKKNRRTACCSLRVVTLRCCSLASLALLRFAVIHSLRSCCSLRVIRSLRSRYLRSARVIIELHAKHK